jgi:hypothetical protein
MGLISKNIALRWVPIILATPEAEIRRISAGK